MSSLSTPLSSSAATRAEAAARGSRQTVGVSRPAFATRDTVDRLIPEGCESADDRPWPAPPKEALPDAVEPEDTSPEDGLPIEDMPEAETPGDALPDEESAGDALTGDATPESAPACSGAAPAAEAVMPSCADAPDPVAPVMLALPVIPTAPEVPALPVIPTAPEVPALPVVPLVPVVPALPGCRPAPAPNAVADAPTAWGRAKIDVPEPLPRLPATGAS